METTVGRSAVVMGGTRVVLGCVVGLLVLCGARELMASSGVVSFERGSAADRRAARNRSFADVAARNRSFVFFSKNRPFLQPSSGQPSERSTVPILGVRLCLRLFTAKLEQAFAVIEIGGPSASQPISIRQPEIREIPAR